MLKRVIKHKPFVLLKLYQIHAQKIIGSDVIINLTLTHICLIFLTNFTLFIRLLHKRGGSID